MHSIAETIQAARQYGAHRPFGAPDLQHPIGIDMSFSKPAPKAARVVRNPTDPLDPDELVICDDQIPAARKKVANKYHGVFEKMKMGQAMKVPGAHCGKVGNALRNWIREQKLDAHVRSILVHPDCPQKLGRVWLMAGPQSAPPVSKAKAAGNTTMRRAA